MCHQREVEMRKLKLVIDDLAVESFTADQKRREPGTVLGQILSAEACGGTTYEDSCSAGCTDYCEGSGYPEGTCGARCASGGGCGGGDTVYDVSCRDYCTVAGTCAGATCARTTCLYCV
jgi:hypothetical protein